VKQLGEDVRRELERFGPEAGMPELVERWPAVVGATIARNAWPARVARDGTLLVNTADSVWAFELTSRGPEIAERVGVAGIRFAAGPLPEPAVEPTEGPRRRPPEPSAAARADADRLAAGIADENLRKVVARAAALSLENAADGRSVW
jgi:hypothetical protein